MKVREQGMIYLQPDLRRMLDNGSPHENVKRAYEYCLSAIAKSLYNYPIDIMVEQWIYKSFPRFRQIQADRAGRLELEHQRMYPDESSDARRLLTIYFHCQSSLDSARAQNVSLITGNKVYSEFYKSRGYGETGNRLLKQVLDSPDRGHLSDVANVVKWAETLGISGMIDWTLNGAPVSADIPPKRRFLWM